MVDDKLQLVHLVTGQAVEDDDVITDGGLGLSATEITVRVGTALTMR